MLRCMVALLVCVNWPISGWAGAWMRDVGSGFVAAGLSHFDQSGAGSNESEPSLYLEYGVRPKLTFGFSGSYTERSGGEVTSFLRIPIKADDAPAKISAEFGIGMRTDLVNFEPFLKTGLSWGRGIKIGEKYGWVNIDTTVLWSFGETEHLLKLDGTIGMGLNDRFQVMGQVFFEGDTADQSITLVPSIIMALGKEKKTKLVAGLEHRRGRRASNGVRFGLWHDFKFDRKRRK